MKGARHFLRLSAAVGVAYAETHGAITPSNCTELEPRWLPQLPRGNFGRLIRDSQFVLTGSRRIAIIWYVS
jgi:hypothetical protein